jgi:hypothetical protein
MLLDQILGFETHAVDAEFIHDLLDSEIRPTAVLMNPPFSATGGRVSANRMIYGARHVESALRRLQQGGRLVAIASEAMSFTRPAFSAWWKALATTYNVRANFHLSGNEYGYGTSYGLQILIIDKTGPTPGDNWSSGLATSTGARQTISKAAELEADFRSGKLMHRAAHCHIQSIHSHPSVKCGFKAVEFLLQRSRDVRI